MIIPEYIELEMFKPIEHFQNYSMLVRAWYFALDRHEGQLRVNKAPYFTHVSRVAYRLMMCYRSVDCVIAGLLHDTVEDKRATVTDLRIEGFSRSTVRTVLDVTRGEFENYFDFIMRIKGCKEDSIHVKLADLQDNMIDSIDSNRLDKYRFSNYILNKELDARRMKEYDYIKRK